MKRRVITPTALIIFERRLRCEEKSPNTISKYLRDDERFAAFTSGAAVCKNMTVAYKESLASKGYAVRSINSMLAALNAFLDALGWEDCKVKSIKLQRQIYCPEERELTKAEYIRLVDAAKQKGNKRLSLILQTICGMGIRVSELECITVEAVKRGETAVSLKGKTRTVFIVPELQRKLLLYADS